MGCQQKCRCVFCDYLPIWHQAETLIYGAFKSGRNQATGSGGDNAPLLMRIQPHTTESDSQRNVKSLAHKCLASSLLEFGFASGPSWA